ncbi:hypothetical protein SK92_00254 [Klebsiella oxytoca]|uniref:hypothetical protein n=1 Tax=Klebsiella oxytoca TaxID=571 RepID=UPI00065A1F1E|nr:hypothetical protein [Klebsiella oxytoca]KLY37120.1 hypothetical protein SK92_00254 [Klebsiella oxytoca]
MITYLRRIGFALALGSGLFCSILIVDGIWRAHRADLEMMVYLVLLVSIYNCVAYFLFEIKPEDKNGDAKESFITLWFKRKKLEEQQRIRELEAKK